MGEDKDTIFWVRKGVGVTLSIISLVLVFDPSLVKSIDPVQDTPPADRFEEIELRARYGFFLFLGLLILGEPRWLSITSDHKGPTWKHRCWAWPPFWFWVCIGYMIPRFIGMILDGSDGGQWRLVFIEGVILVITIALMVYRRRQLAEEADVETGAEEED